MPADSNNKDRNFFMMCVKKDMQELGYHNFPSVAEKYQWLELVYAFRQLDALVLEITAFFGGSLTVVKSNADVIVPWDSMKKIYMDREKSYLEKRELLISEYKCYQLIMETAAISSREQQKRLQQIGKVFLSFATCLAELGKFQRSGGCDGVAIDEVVRELQGHFEKFKVSLQLGVAHFDELLSQAQVVVSTAQGIVTEASPELRVCINRLAGALLIDGAGHFLIVAPRTKNSDQISVATMESGKKASVWEKTCRFIQLVYGFLCKVLQSFSATLATIPVFLYTQCCRVFSTPILTLRGPARLVPQAGANSSEFYPARGSTVPPPSQQLTSNGSVNLSSLGRS